MPGSDRPDQTQPDNDYYLNNHKDNQFTYPDKPNNQKRTLALLYTHFINQQKK